jgi:hypothetical protein
MIGVKTDRVHGVRGQERASGDLGRGFARMGGGGQRSISAATDPPASCGDNRQSPSSRIAESAPLKVFSDKRQRTPHRPSGGRNGGGERLTCEL